MSAFPEKKTKRVPFHVKYEIKKINGYGTIKPKVGLVLTEIIPSGDNFFNEKDQPQEVKKPKEPQEPKEPKEPKEVKDGKWVAKSIPYVITDVSKNGFLMARLYGYDKKFAIIDDTVRIESILENGKWRRSIDNGSYFVFGIASLL
jgi:hypothetical protein